MRARSRSINSATDFLITPTMQAPLETSLVLRKGTGAPTYSRTTAAWRFNELGYLENIDTGCAVFKGARFIRNTTRTKSEDFSNFSWTKSGGTTVTGTNTVVCANAAGSPQYLAQTPVAGIISGNMYLLGARAKYITGGVEVLQLAPHITGFGSGQYANFSLLTGEVNAVGCVATSKLNEDGSYDLIIKVEAIASGTYDYNIVCLVNSLSSARFAFYTGDGVKSFELLRAWTYNITGYPLSYNPEYVSVGVVSTPFFGAGSDGAKYFSTDYTRNSVLNNLDGITIESAATNNLLRSRRFANPTVNDLTAGSSWLCTQTVGAELVTNGTFDADTNWTKGATWTIGSGVATCTTAAGDHISQGLSGAGVTSGKTYVVTYTMTRSAGSLVASLGSSASDLGKTRSSGGTFTETIYCGANTTLYFYGYGSFAGTLDNVSIKECAMQIAFTTGISGSANSATTLTASATDATILQSVTLGSAARCGSVYVKRRTGTGTISFTIDGGASWTDITPLINSSTYTRVQITATLTNPSVGFKIGTSGDAIDVDCVQLESGSLATSPIVTTTVAVTRNADSLTYQTSGNFSDTVGTAYVEVMPLSYSGGAIGSATNGLLLSTSNSGATAFDGTNAANGPTGTTDASEKLALNWTGTAMKVASSGVVGTAGTYDGAMGLSNIGIGVGANGNFRNAAVYPYALSDSDMVKITT